MAVCANCVIGSLDEGTPKGKESTIAGVPCYISEPPTGSSAAIILGTDVFGYKLPNARLIADAFADNGFLCVVPDYFKGEPMDMQMLLTYESLPGLSLLGKARSYLWLAWKWMGMGAWLKRHPADCAIDVVTAAAAELRDKHGARKVGLQGYCYGGLVGVLMVNRPQTLDAVCSAHPGAMIRIPKELEAAAVPLLFICPGKDAWFPEKTRAAAEKMLEEKSPGLARFVIYPGTQHGFAGVKMQCAVRSGPLLLLFLVTLAALHAPAAHARSLADSRSCLLHGRPVTITINFVNPNAVAATRAARAAGPPHTSFGTRTATGPQRRSEVANDVVVLTGVPDCNGLRFEVPDPSNAGVNLLVLVQDSKISFTASLNARLAADIKSGRRLLESGLIVNSSDANTFVLGNASSFAASISVGNNTSISNGDSTLNVSGIYNSTGAAFSLNYSNITSGGTNFSINLDQPLFTFDRNNFTFVSEDSLDILLGFNNTSNSTTTNRGCSPLSVLGPAPPQLPNTNFFLSSESSRPSLAPNAPPPAPSCLPAIDTVCVGMCVGGTTTGYTAAGRSNDPVALCVTNANGNSRWIYQGGCFKTCAANSLPDLASLPTDSGVDPSLPCNPDASLAHGFTCELKCKAGYVAAAAGAPKASCVDGKLQLERPTLGSCLPKSCDINPLDAFMESAPLDPSDTSKLLLQSFSRADGGGPCEGGQDGQVCNGACLGAPTGNGPPVTATCVLGVWQFQGRCPVGPTVDVHLVTSGLTFNIFTTFNPFTRDIPQNIGGSLNPTASSFSTTQFFSSSVYVDGAAWRGSGGSLQPKALGPLQQLLADLIRLGVLGVLPGFSSSLGRLAGLSIDEAATLLSLQQASVTVAAKQGSRCYAGTQAFAPEGTPCYRCPPDSISQDGSQCTPCTIVNSEPNPAQTACSCKYGYDAVLLGGQLQMCMQWYLNCAAIPHSEVNAIGTGCSCRYGFKGSFDPTTGKLAACTPIDCSTTPGADLDAAGAGCTCKPGFKQTVAADGSLQCVSEVQPAADDVAAGTAGTWLTIAVLENDPGSPTLIKSVSGPALGGRAIIAPDAVSGKDVIRYISNTPASSGTDTFNYTTELGSAVVSVTLTPGPCTESSCGIQRRNAAAQPGTCQAGRCVCVPGSGMASVFVRNPSAAAAALTPQVPACRYRGFTPVGDFTAPGKIVDIVAAAGEQSLSFRLSKDAAAAECATIQPVTFLGIRQLKACPDARKRSSVPTPSALAPKYAVDLSLSCDKGLYSIAVPIPGGQVGSCYDVMLRLADGTSRRTVMRDVGSGSSG
ncbi:hypothetical protein OEZ85_003162 [Tetradesmus obliquus]|uniref:Dienelactone hydrolase domain-containing protein n=1 Tax=Tetradesmus obliquus TaxID=3088 RepID=A0ABY8U0C9_TETOB|nr:hypothetical protein OEZ85_003162 [Tetradesmus obliquus]